jgi:hypothetical protein
LPTIQVLQPGYYPYPTTNSYSLPTGNIQQNYQLRKEISDDLSMAFSKAPQTVKDDLCALTGVFIDSNSCLNGDVNNCQNVTNGFPVSWGYRSSDNKDLGNMYIAIPGSLWASSTHAMPFSAYEQTVLTHFAQNSGNSSWGTTYSLPTISSANPDASWAAVLAALSHELGHVKFNYTIHPHGTHGKNYKLDALQSCSTGTSSIDFFSGWSYGNNPKKLVPKDTWRFFSHQESDDNGLKIDHSMAPYLAPPNKPNFADPLNDPNQLLYTLYTGSSQPWASFWGAWSPDEDFVETYVLYALSANVQNLYISINGKPPYDIISGVSGKPALQNKVQCVANLPVI